jgi:predicted nucleic acid-binding Zn ribbon protein
MNMPGSAAPQDLVRNPGYGGPMARGPSGRRSSKVESVAELLPRLLDDLGLDDASLQVQVLRVWDQALGPVLAPHCRPEGLRRGQVLALVRDSAWMQRLSLEKPAILSRFGLLLGASAPQGIRFRIGKLDAL